MPPIIQKQSKFVQGKISRNAKNIKAILKFQNKPKGQIDKIISYG